MYSLHQFDTRKASHKFSAPLSSTNNARGETGRISKNYLKRLSRNQIKEKKVPPFFRTHAVYHCNDNYFIVVQEGDDFATISWATGLEIEELLDFNDLTLDYSLTIGDILFLRKKSTKAAKKYKNQPHIVQPGQSMYDISQMYGIRLKNLYKLNNLSPREYEIKVGDLIWLR
jgi:LysM repeat protein